MKHKPKRAAAVDMEVTAPDPKVHADEMIDLVCKVFGTGGFYAFRDYCRNGYVYRSHYDWAASRIGIVGGRIATHYGVWDYRMRVGSAVLRVGGIGVVATDPAYRGKGLMARTIEATHEAMRAGGYDLAMLFGIRDFYHRYGYCRAWSERIYYVERSRIPKGRPKTRWRKFTEFTGKDIERMHNRETAGLTGSAVRPTYTTHMANDRNWSGYRWNDASGRLAGYVVVTTRWGKFECVELGGDVEEGLKLLGILAHRAGYNEVKLFGVHYGSALGAWLRRNNARLEMSYWRSGGPMVCTINLASSLKKLCPELERRLKSSCLAGWSGKLLIQDARESAALDIRRSRVAVVAPGRASHSIRGGNEIAQLLIGTDEPVEVIESGGMRLSGDARELAAVLFPNQHPNLAPADRY